MKKRLYRYLSLARLYNARPHWGKYFSLGQDDIEILYPDLKNFREICRQLDPGGVFQNDFTREVLGFERDHQESSEFPTL